MFVQLRRVVYLLVLLQCCACVAYADTEAQSAASDKDAVRIDELMKNLTTDRDTDAEDLLTSINIDLSALKEGVALCKKRSEGAEAVVKKLEELKTIADGKKGTGFTSWETDKKSKFEMSVKEAIGIIHETNDAVQRTRRAQGHCKTWLIILNEVAEHVGALADNDIEESQGSTPNETIWTPLTTYGELLILKGSLHIATKWNNLSSLFGVETQVKEVEKKLKELEDSDNSIKTEIDNIRKAMNKDKPVKPFDAMLEQIKERVKKERGVVKAKNQRNAPGVDQIRSEQGPQGGNERQDEDDSPNAQTEQQQTQVQQQQQPAHSPQSSETPATDGPTERTESTAGTVNTDAPTATTAPTTTVTTTTASTTAVKKKKPQDAANAPLSTAAVLAVVALTVLTVIGVAVV